jgi:membrane protease YdiL (CAAX protease family)
MVIVFIGSPVKFDIENIFFQLTMPGIEEEIAYRGIMLGLLNKILTPKIKIFDKSLGSPAIWITAILFGLSHGLFITDSFKIIFNYFPFLSAIFSGFIWGWITLRSGSILLSVISHNLTNVINNLIVIIKD